MGYTSDSNTSPQHNKITFHAILIISLCASFLFYKYILQNFPSVMSEQLMSTFNLQGLGLGVLSGVYFWTYLIVPLFVGIIIDRYGAQWITSAAILCCAFGIYIFSQAQELHIAIFARSLTGIGVSFASIAYFKLAAVWFPKKYYALLTSLLVTAAMIGAIFGQMPLAWLIEHIGWRSSLSYLGWLGFALAFLFLFIVKDKNSHELSHFDAENKSVHKNNQMWRDIFLIIKNKQNWLLTGYSGLAFSPIVIFCGLWGNPFLQNAYHLNKLISPSLISLVFVGLALSCPLFAIWSNRIQNRCAFIFYSTLVSALSISLVIYAHPMPIWLLGSLLFLFGFSLGGFPIVFVIGKESNPLYLAGTVTSMINASDAFLDAVSEPAIGKILDVFSHGGAYHDFSIFSYHIALAILPIFQIMGACLILWVKDRSHEKEIMEPITYSKDNVLELKNES